MTRGKSIGDASVRQASVDALKSKISAVAVAGVLTSSTVGSAPPPPAISTRARYGGLVVGKSGRSTEVPPPGYVRVHW